MGENPNHNNSLTMSNDLEIGGNMKNYFSKLKKKFDISIIQYMKLLINQNTKLAKAKNKLIFLLRCRRDKKIPKNRLMKNVHKIDNQIFLRIQNKFIYAIINQEISEVNYLIKNLDHEIINIKLKLNSTLPENIYKNFIRNITCRYEELFEKTKISHQNKFKNMNSAITPDNNSNEWLINLTNTNIPVEVQNVLKKGDKFVPPITRNNIPMNNIICDVETAITKFPDNVKHEARNNFINILTNFATMSKQTKTLTLEETKFLKNNQKTKTFLKDHPELLVTKADKSNVTVIIQKDIYIQKMNDLLNDQRTYIKIKKFSTEKIKSNLNSMVTKWHENRKIDDVTLKKLKNLHGHEQRIYGLPKTHKPNYPLRPIVSAIGSPLYELASFIANILKPSVVQSAHMVKNAEQFVENTKNLIIPDEYEIVSLDVVSLFTNIDNNLFLALIKKNWKNIKNKSGTKLTKPQFLDALDLLLNNCEFSFNNVGYKQIFGTPMGSPISPVIAEFVMQYVETSVLAKLQQIDISPIFYYRYVDDIITCFDTKHINTVLSTFNNFNKFLSFTAEREKENSIPFLDVLIIRDQNQLITNWYHKKSWSGRYMDFSSNLPKIYKKNTVLILAEKIIKLSDPKFHQNNFNILKSVLIKNNYPENFIHKMFNKVKHKSNHGNTNNYHNQNSNPPRRISLPYVQGLFEKLKSFLLKYNIQAVARPHTNLYIPLFSKLKDKITKDKQTNIVYKSKCECGSEYIGKTGQTLKKRTQQHIADSTSHAKSEESMSALSLHLKNSTHHITLDNFTILEKESNPLKRSIKEMIHIKKSKNTLNKQTDTKYLENIYDNLIPKFHN